MSEGLRFLAGRVLINPTSSYCDEDLNACRHRGAQLTDEPRGEKTRFTCPFHAWTYAPDGRLMGIRRAKMFGDVDKSCHNLLELPTQEKYGFLIVHPQVDGEVDIDALLGADLAEELANWEFEKTQFEGETSVTRDLNWKLANDTFGENYHFSTLHSDTLSHLAHSDYATYDEYGRNHRSTVEHEDYLMSEKAQVTVNGGKLDYFLFGRNELALHHFHNNYLEALGEPPLREYRAG